MILALLIGCLTPETFTEQRLTLSCDILHECVPTFENPHCTEESIGESAASMTCEGIFHADLAADCLDSYAEGEHACDDPFADIRCDWNAICEVEPEE